MRVKGGALRQQFVELGRRGTDTGRTDDADPPAFVHKAQALGNGDDNAQAGGRSLLRLRPLTPTQ